MGKKNNRNRIVFSTDPDFQPPSEDPGEESTPPPNQQDLRVLIDRKQRRGKEVTLITGFVGTEEDRKALGKMLKTKCGGGGAVKNGEIMVQGNHRDTIIEILKKQGYKVKASGG